MANPLYNGNNNFMSQMMQQAQELKRTVPNPRAEVERLLQTGQMSQQEFNALMQQAQSFLPFIKN